MLVLRRRPGESLLIGDDVEIEVLDTGSWGVKVGISAPKGITILRKELRVVREANRQAAREVPVSELAKSLQIFSRTNSYKPSAPR